MKASRLPDSTRILTINSGSSSLKLALFHVGQSETLVLSGGVERIGLRASRFYVKNADNETLADQHSDLPDHDSALNTMFEWLQDYAPGQDLDAVGHRIVHGGPDYTQPHLVTPELVATLNELTPLAPDHLPHELKAIHSVSRSYPQLPQAVCFDTAFHRHMPDVAQVYAIPRHYRNEGVLRYGFHGLSYEYIMQELQSVAGSKVAGGRVIIAHLGNGASMAAVRHGQSMDTTMGLTPAGGLVMSTRAGDLDPGVILYLIEEKGLRPASVNEMLNQHSGLLGVSGTSSDMKDLLDQAAVDPHAAEAVALFCYQGKKFLGALSAVLGGLDTLIFTGGIGENAPVIRKKMCEGMGFLGLYLDTERNAANAPVVSRKGSPVTVRVMKTDEELMIAQHTYNLIYPKRSGIDGTAHPRGPEKN
jgi:acetate kinase